MNILPIEIPRNGSASLRDTLGVNDNPRHWPVRIWQKRRPDVFDRALVVAIVRNPYIRVIRQWWAHHRVNNTGESFGDWVCRVYGRKDRIMNDDHEFWRYLWWPQADWVTGKAGTVAVDYTLRFETLAGDWEHLRLLCQSLDIEVRPLMHRNASGCPHGLEVYTDAARDTVANYFSEDFRTFGYDINQL